MADPKGLYQTLEVAPSASDDEIRKAYRKLALRWHPDKNPDDPEATAKFQKISSAYAVLSDEKQRAQYDRTGCTGDDDVGDFADFGDLDEMMEMFASAFGGGFSMGDDMDDEIAFLLGAGGGGRRRKGKMSSKMRSNLGPGVRGGGRSSGRGSGNGFGMGMPCGAFPGMGGMSAEEEEAFNEVMFGMSGMGLGGKGKSGGYPGGKGGFPGGKGCPPGMPPDLMEMMGMMAGMDFADDSDEDFAAFAREVASSATEVKREPKPRGRNEPLRPKKPKKRR